MPTDNATVHREKRPSEVIGMIRLLQVEDYHTPLWHLLKQNKHICAGIPGHDSVIFLRNSALSERRPSVSSSRQ